MKLNFKFYPKEELTPSVKSQNLIILHGLFGSSKNWVSVSKFLSKYYNVYSLDLRNHGDSPHSEVHSIESMSTDLEEFIQDHSLKDVSLLGHSMGGLVAMYFDLTHPGLLTSLIIQDISPRDYPFIYEKEVESMSQDISESKSRSEIDSQMATYVPDTFIRQFLQMNLERSPEGKYYWKLNVRGISKARKLFSEIFYGLPKSDTISLFVLGGASEYIRPEDHKTIENFYKKSLLKTIEGGGHYIHFTHALEFTKILEDFVNSIRN
ncbi:alpha/beta fold hydrolase [Leptospira ognonensis]|uniref:Alpha/beta fold hydrolase n=1 Tax=Leptospira ognonensis TaxID=2484945 RepID=A0A4R9K8V4_9LEPT|nr:alpha/beta fold hydrolase [Leptospira ognonensis]TGL63044.1 alpha/beta fold hydrolase [Leptospira ognonensis]